MNPARLALTIALALAACGRAEPTVELPATGRRALAVPRPDLSRLDPATRTRIAHAIAAAERPDAGDAAFGELAMLFQIHDLRDAARTSYDAALALDPGNSRWRYLRAHVLRFAGETETASAEFDAVAAALARDVDRGRYRGAALYWSALVRLDAGDEDGARTRLSEARALLGDEPGLLLAMARSVDDPKRAAAILDIALGARPDSADLLTQAAAAHRRAGNDPRARSLAARVAAANAAAVFVPDPWLDHVRMLTEAPAALRQRGDRFVADGDIASALRAYRAALALAPEDSITRTNLAAALLSGGRDDEASAELEHVLRDVPDHVPALVNLGVLHARRGDDALAANAFDAALAIDPRNAQALRGSAVLAARAGDLSRAAEAAIQVLLVDPNDEESRRLAARALALAGRPDEAISLLRAGGDDAGVLSDLARVLAVSPETGDRRAALVVAARAVRAGGGPEALLAEAHARASLAQSAEAMGTLRRASVLATGALADEVAETLLRWNREGPASALWSRRGAFSSSAER